MRLTTINNSIKNTGYELINGHGYFYFCPLSDDVPELYDSSVMTTTLGKDLKFWTDELDFRIRSTR